MPHCHEESFIATLVPTPSAARAQRRPDTAVAAEPHAIERAVLAAALLWLLVGPRVELPGTVPLRVEDLVFALLAVLCLRHLRALRPQRLLVVAVLAVVVTGLLSAGVASARGLVTPVNATLFAVRPLEYFIAFPAALLLVRSVQPRWQRLMDVLLAVTTVLQTAFAVLQYYFQIPIGFSHAAYTRAAGLTVGPYELGAISAALAVYWVARGRWVLASLSVVALASSVARVSILAAALGLTVLSVVWVVRQVRRVRRVGWAAAFRPYAGSRLGAAVQVLAVAIAGLVLAFTLGLLTPPALPGPQAEPAGSAASEEVAPEAPSPEPTEDAVAGPELPSAPSESVTTRLQGTSILGSWEAAGYLIDRVPPVRTDAEYQDVAYSHMNDYVNASSAAQIGAEPSNLVRFFRWHLILHTMDDPVDVALGLGPSWVGPSVDGSYLRFYADGGLLGVAAWLFLIVVWLRRSTLWMVCVTLTLLVGALFIDIVYAQRPMVLFWALLAVAVAERARAVRSRSDVEAPEGGSQPDPVAGPAVRTPAASRA